MLTSHPRRGALALAVASFPLLLWSTIPSYADAAKCAEIFRSIAAPAKEAEAKPKKSAARAAADAKAQESAAKEQARFQQVSDELASLGRAGVVVYAVLPDESRRKWCLVNSARFINCGKHDRHHRLIRRDLPIPPAQAGNK